VTTPLDQLAPPVEVLLEGPLTAVRAAFGMLLDRLMAGPAREPAEAAFEIPGEQIGPVIGAGPRAHTDMRTCSLPCMRVLLSR